MDFVVFAMQNAPGFYRKQSKCPSRKCSIRKSCQIQNDLVIPIRKFEGTQTLLSRREQSRRVLLEVMLCFKLFRVNILKTFKKVICAQPIMNPFPFNTLHTPLTFQAIHTSHCIEYPLLLLTMLSFGRPINRCNFHRMSSEEWLKEAVISHEHSVLFNSFNFYQIN